jgi:hypothetical protein
MALPDRSAEHLDRALDAQLHGREENQDDSYAGLLTAFSRLKAMNEQVSTDAKLCDDLWRSMMSTIPLAQSVHSRNVSQLPIPGRHTLPFRAGAKHRARRSPLLHTVLAIALLLALILGTLGYRQYRVSDDGSNIPAPMAAQLRYQGPNVADCSTQPRDPGTVEELAGQPPSEPSIFPRYGLDPLQSPNNPTDFSSKTMDGGKLLAQAEPVFTTDPAIYDFLDQVFNCSPYLLVNASGFNLDGRYLALYSDDFFRREFAGYKEAGTELRLARVWSPNGFKPEILEIRTIGDRILLILNRTPIHIQGSYYIALLLAKGSTGWQIDEVGTVTTSVEWNPAAITSATPIASPTAGADYGSPLEVGFTLFDKRAAGEPPPANSNIPTICDALVGGADVTCDWYYDRRGPWGYSEYPADRDFTFVLSNITNEGKRFEVKGLGISITIGPNETVPIVINAASGSYLFEVFDDDSQSPFAAGVLTFNSPGQQYSQG